MAQKKKLTEQIASKVYQEAVKKFVTADRQTQNRTQQQLASSGRNLMQQAAARRGQDANSVVSSAVNNLRTGGTVYERPSFDRTYADAMQKLLRSNPDAAKQLAQGPTVPDTFRNLQKATGLYSAQGGAQVSPTYQALVKKYFDAAPTTETQQKIQALGGYGALTPEQLAAMGSKENYRPELDSAWWSILGPAGSKQVPPGLEEEEKKTIWDFLFDPEMKKASRQAYINQQTDLQAAQAYGANDTAQNLLTNIGIVSDDYLSYMQKQLPGMWEDERLRYEQAMAEYESNLADYDERINNVNDFVTSAQGHSSVNRAISAAAPYTAQFEQSGDYTKYPEILKALSGGDMGYTGVLTAAISFDNAITGNQRTIQEVERLPAAEKGQEISRLVNQYDQYVIKGGQLTQLKPDEPRSPYPYNKLLDRVNTEAAARETMLPYFNAIADDPDFIEKSAFIPRYPQGEGVGFYSEPDLDVNVALGYYVDDGTGRLTENPWFFLAEPDRDRIEYLIVNGEVPIDGSKMYVSPLIANEYFGSGYDMMTDVEKSTYNYHYNNEDYATARAFLKDMSPTLRDRAHDIRNMTWEELATDNAFTGTLAFLTKGVTGTAAALSYPLELGLNALGVENVDNPFVDYRNVVGQAQLAELEDADWLGLELAGQNIPQMAYNVASSMQDMFTARGAANALGAPNAALNLMGMQARAHDFTETAGTDMSLLERAIHAEAVGALETLTEKLPFDAINARPGGLGYLARSFGSEFGEEAFNQAAGYALDDLTALAFGRETPTQAELTQMELMGVENPGAELFRQRGEETLGAGVVGGLAGLGMGTTQTIADATQSMPTGRQINKAGNGAQLVELGSKMKEGSESRKLAEQLIERTNNGKKLSSMQLGQLYRTLIADTHQEYQDVIRDLTKSEVAEAIAQKYQDLGLEPETTFTTEELAEGIIAMADNKKISGRLQKFIETHRVTQEIAREFAEEKNPEFWVQQLGSKRTGETLKHLARVSEIDSTKQKQTPAPTQQQGGAIQQETEAETRRLAGSSTAAADSREVVFSDGSGERTGDIVRVERTNGGLQVVVNDGGTERTVAYDAINRVGGSGVARILAYAQQHIEAEAPEVNLMLEQLKNGGEAADIISAVEEGVTAGFFGAAAPNAAKPNNIAAEAVQQSAREKAGKKGAQAVQQAAEAQTTMDDAARQKLIQAGYSLGQQMAQDAEGQRLQRVGRGAAGRGAVSYMGTVANEANVTDTGVRKAVKGIRHRMTAQQNAAISAIKQIAAATGIDFVLYESQAAQGEEVAAPNGFFDAATNAIYLDLNSGRNVGGEALAETAVIKTAAHELTHYIERNSGQEYAAFREAAKQELATRGQDYAQLVMNKVQERRLNRTQAQAEVLADAAEMMLKDSEAIQRLAKNKPGLLSTVKKFLQDFARRIRRAFEDLTGTSAEAQALTQVVNGVERYVGNLQQLWDDALVTAAGNVDGRATEAAGERVMSLRETKDMSWTEQVDEALSKQIKRSSTLTVLRNYNPIGWFGVTDYPLGMDLGDFRKIAREERGSRSAHNLSKDILLALPGAIKAPVAIFENVSRNSLYVITDLLDANKKPIVAIIQKNQIDNEGVKMHKIKSVYGMKNFAQYMLEHLEPGSKFTINNEEAFTHLAGAQYTMTEADYQLPAGTQKKQSETDYRLLLRERFNEIIPRAEANVKQYSSRRSAMSIRQALSTMAITPDMTGTEKSLLQIYQKYATELTGAQEQMAEQEAILQGDTATADEKRQAENRLKTLRGMARRAEAKLRQAERSEGFATLMDTSREMVRRFMASEGFEQTAASVEDQLTELKRELQNVRNDLSGYSQEQQAKMLRQLFDPAALTRAAKNLKTSYQSRMTQKEISNRLAIMYANMYATDGDAAVRFHDQLQELASDLLGSARGGASETLELLKEHIGSIRLTEAQVQELKSQGINMSTFKRVVNPVVKISSSKNADTLMSYITPGDEDIPNPAAALFTGYTSEGDAIVRLYEMIKAERENWDNTAQEDKDALLSTMVDITEQAGLPAPEGAKASDIILGAMLKSADVSDKMQKRLRELDAKLATARKSVNTMKVKAAQREGLPQEIARYYAKLEQERRLMEVQEETERIKTQLKTENRGKMQEFFTTRELMEKNASLKRQIKRTVTMLDRRIRKETDSNRVPEGFKPVVEDMIRLFIRTNDVMHIFARNEIGYAAKVYEKLAALDGTDIHQLDDMYKEDIEATLNGLRTAIEAFAANMPNMTQAQKLAARNQALEDINDLVQEVRKVTIDIDQTIIGDQRASIAQTAGAMVNELEKKENYSTREGKAGDIAEKLKDAARNGNLTPVYFFRLLGNETLTRLNRDIESAESRYGRQVREATETVRSIQDRHNYYAWKDDEALTFTTAQGQGTNPDAHTITLTKDEALALWATWKREHTDGLYTSSHLENGGFKLKTGKRVVNGRVERDTGGHKLTQADMNTIADYLTDEQKAYADEMVQYLSTDMAELGNETSMELFGIRKFKESYYFPMSVDRGQLAQKSSAGATFPDANRIAHTSMTKRRVDQANKPLAIGSFTDVAADHINQMLLYNTFAIPIENLNRVLNQVTEDETGSAQSLRQMLEKKYGKDLYDYLVRYIADLNGGPQRDSTEKGWDKLLGLYKKGAVAASMSVAVQQPMSVIRAMMEVNPKYFIPLMNHADNINWSREHEQLLQYSGVAVLKDIGGFDMTNVGGASSAIAGNIEDTYDMWKRWRLRLGIGDAKGAERWKAMGRTWNDLFGFFASKADELTWTYMWRAIKAETADRNPGMDTGSEAFLQLAADRFNEVMRLTQVYDSTLVRSQNMRSKTAFMKMFTAFMAEPTLTANMLMDAAASKKPKKIARAAGVFLISQLLTAAASAVVKAGRDDDDDKTWQEKWLSSMGSSLGGWGSNLNPLTLLPGFRDLMSLLDGYDIERSDMSVVTDVLEEINKLSSGKYDGNPWAAVEGAGGAVANLLGIPLKNVMRDLRTMYNTVFNNAQRPSSTLVMENDALYNFRLRYIWEPKTGFDVYYGRLYEAYRSGDTQEQARLKEYLTINGKDEGDVSSGVRSAVKKQLQENHITPAEAKEFLLKNGLAENEKKAFEYVDKWAEEEDTEEEDYSYSVYNSVYEHIEADDKAEAEKAVKELVANGWKEKEVRSAIRSYANAQYVDGAMDKEKVKKIHETYGGYEDSEKMDENDWYWHFRKLDYRRENGTTDGYQKLGKLYSALEKSSASDVRAAMSEMTAHGYTQQEAESEVHSYLAKQYMAGKMTFAKLKTLSGAYGGWGDADNNDWYWEQKRLDYGKSNGGKTEGYSKYKQFYDAIEKGSNLKSVIHEYTSHGVEAKTLSGCITTQYKDEFIQLSKTNRTAAANLQARLLNAYVALGYDRQKKLKDIQAWLK